MDWSNERYVRMYVRDTAEWLLLSWEAKALLALTLRKADRRGHVQCGRHGARGLAALVGMPADVVTRALPELLEDGCLVEEDGGFAFPNFVAAQETRLSDAERKRAQRERERDVTDGHAESRPVTRGHTESRDVTDGHAESLCAVPSHAVPTEDPTKGAGGCATLVGLPEDAPLTDEFQAIADTFAMNTGDFNTLAEWELFRSHHRANGKLSASWPDLWRNWLRRRPALRRGGGKAARLGSGTADDPPEVIRYVQAVARGKGAPYAWPATEAALADLQRAITTHAVYTQGNASGAAPGTPVEGELRLEWLDEVAEDFGRALAERPDAARFYFAGDPRGLLRWLNERSQRAEARRVG